MKNVTLLPATEVFKVSMAGLLPNGPLWAVQYVSGIDSPSQTEPGDWLCQWQPSPEFVTFGFSKDRDLHFTDESAAESVSNELRKETEIETKVVKVRG